jgi:pimeloyl-ACP methyl ester carboxylesterase
MTTSAETATGIHPFHIDTPQEQFDDLRRRLSQVRWPAREPVADRSQGVQLTTMEALAGYWATEHDWRTAEAQLNAVPQFLTTIDGVDVHFIHVRSEHENALPLIITHGWPGSVIEMLGLVGPLTAPTAHGGRVEDAFDLVVPSLPGFGFSAQPREVGWDPGHVARAWAELMGRLGYTRYVAQGGDVGAAVTDTMAVQAPDGLAGIHLNFLRRPPPDVAAAVFGDAAEPEGLTEEEREGLGLLRAQFRKGYIIEQGQTPQTIGYSLTDSPVGLASWILDHDTDAYEKVSSAFLDDRPSGGLTRDHVLDNITLYWLTRTGASAARMYWESARATAAAAAAGQALPTISLPVAFTVFPGEIYRAPRGWAERVYPNLVYFNEVDHGGHFAAWEEPEVFSAELRAALRSLRQEVEGDSHGLVHRPNRVPGALSGRNGCAAGPPPP